MIIGFHPDYFLHYSIRQREFLKRCVIKDIIKNLDIFQSIDYELVNDICTNIVSNYYDHKSSNYQFVIDDIKVLVDFSEDDRSSNNIISTSLTDKKSISITINHGTHSNFHELKSDLIANVALALLKSDKQCTEDELYMYNSFLAFSKNSYNEETYFYWLFWLYYEKVTGHERTLKTNHITIFEPSKTLSHSKKPKDAFGNSFYGDIMNWMNSEMVDVFNGEKKILNNIDHWEIFNVVDEMIVKIQAYYESKDIFDSDKEPYHDDFTRFSNENHQIYDSVNSIYHRIISDIADQNIESDSILAKTINGVGKVKLKINITTTKDFTDQENIITCNKEIIDNEVFINVDIIEHNVFLGTDFLTFKHELLKCLIELD